MSETTKTYELDKQVKIRTLLPLKKRGGTVGNTLIRIPRLWRYMFQTKNDAYVVMLPETTILLLAFRHLTKSRIIAAERVDPAVYPNYLAKPLRYYARKADGFVFQTEDAKKWYGESIKNIQTAVIPNAINPSFIRPGYEGEREKTIAGVGRLNDQKNFSLLIKAFALIADDFPDYRLVIYGEGEKRHDLENLVREMGLSERVSLPGNIQNIAEVLEKQSLFVLSSDFEGMPNALMEAMALGLPCISTDCPCGGPRFLIRNNVNGVLVPVGDADALAKAMKQLLTEPDFSREIATNAQTIQKRLAPDKIYGQWESFIQRVIEETN